MHLFLSFYPFRIIFLSNITRTHCKKHSKVRRHYLKLKQASLIIGLIIGTHKIATRQFLLMNVVKDSENSKKKTLFLTSTLTESSIISLDGAILLRTEIAVYTKGCLLNHTLSRRLTAVSVLSETFAASRPQRDQLNSSKVLASTISAVISRSFC